MPKMLGDVVPLVSQPLVDHLHAEVERRV